MKGYRVVEKQISIKKNIVMSIILTTSNFFFPIMSYGYVARILTPAGTGKVAFVSSILQYFSYIATLGIPAYGLRECAKIREDKEKLSQLVQELLIINICSTIVAYIVLIVTVISIVRFQEYKTLFLVMSTYIFFNIIGLEWLYQALEEYTYITIRSIFFKLLSLVLTFILITKQDDILWYGFLTVFTSSASYICNFLNIRKKISLKRKKTYNLKKHLKPIFTLFFASLIIGIYANFDISMIGFIRDEREVGLYNAALKIKNILLSLSTAITSVIIPRISYCLQKKEQKKTYLLIAKSFRISLIIAMPIAFYIFVFAKDVIFFVCGNQYLDAEKTLKILMACIIPLILTNLFGNQILIPNGDEKRYSQSVFVGMWINLILNILMIPTMGSYGAALGTLITECWNVIWLSGGAAQKYRNYIKKNISLRVYFIPMFLALLISAGMGYIVEPLTVFWRLFFTSLIYFGIYYILLIIKQEPLTYDIVRDIITKIQKE